MRTNLHSISKKKLHGMLMFLFLYCKADSILDPVILIFFFQKETLICNNYGTVISG